MTQSSPDAAPLVSVDTNEARGVDIKRRRLALGIRSLNKFDEATGIDRTTLGKAESGQASPQKMDEIEAWLDRAEEENGQTDEVEAGPVKVTMHGVYGVDELIFEGGGNPDEVASYVGRILEELKRRT